MNKNFKAALIVGGVVTGLLAITFVASAAGTRNFASMPFDQQMMQQTATAQPGGNWQGWGGNYGDGWQGYGMMGPMMGGWNGGMMNGWYGHMMDYDDMPYYHSGNNAQGYWGHCW